MENLTEEQRTQPGLFEHCEIEINTACDLACFACDRMSDVTTAPNMTVDQVKLFVEESLDLKWKWKRIRILGGEPTLHPHLREIASLLVSYRNHYPDCFLQLLSNGLGKLKEHKKWLVEQRIDPHVEGKKPNTQPAWFNNSRIVPLDRDPDIGEVEPCGIFGVAGCGIGLTRHGYFLDGAGATICRVKGYNIGKMSLKEVTWDAMIEQSKIVCRVCGHWNPKDGKKVTELVQITGQVTGEFWTETLQDYAKSKPVLSIFGEKGDD